MKRLLPFAFLAACGGGATATDAACDELCGMLYEDCAYGAFPSMDSCLEGCAWDAEQGADVEHETDCVADAACDTFGVLDCQHRFGP
jgi:hypothetical protein